MPLVWLPVNTDDFMRPVCSVPQQLEQQSLSNALISQSRTTAKLSCARPQVVRPCIHSPKLVLVDVLVGYW